MHRYYAISCAVAPIISQIICSTILKMRKLRLREYWGRNSPSTHQNPSFLFPIHTVRTHPGSLQLGVAVWLNSLQRNVSWNRGAWAITLPTCSYMVLLTLASWDRVKHDSLGKTPVEVSDSSSAWVPESPPFISSPQPGTVTLATNQLLLCLSIPCLGLLAKLFLL